MKKSKAKPKITKPAKVNKIIQSPHPDIPEKAEISLKDGDDLYREIRIDNTHDSEMTAELARLAGADASLSKRGCSSRLHDTH